MGKIWAIEKKINEQAKLIEIDSDFKNIQEFVGGSFDIFRYSPILNERKIDIFLNDEGKILGLEPTIVILNEGSNEVIDYIGGNILIASTNDCGDTVGLSREQIDIIENMFKEEAIVTMGVNQYSCGIIRI